MNQPIPHLFTVSKLVNFDGFMDPVVHLHHYQGFDGDVISNQCQGNPKIDWEDNRPEPVHIQV